jgi:hypothetical protein
MTEPQIEPTFAVTLGRDEWSVLLAALDSHSSYLVNQIGKVIREQVAS